jgi:hypothetical protein
VLYDSDIESSGSDTAQLVLLQHNGPSVLKHYEILSCIIYAGQKENSDLIAKQIPEASQMFDSRTVRRNEGGPV